MKQPLKQMRTGFTLIELMVAIGIIVLLAAIVLPALARTRREGKRTDTISNLRQCGIALSLYCEDYDGVVSMPTYEVAQKLLSGTPTCDKADYWRTSCATDWGKPLIGSYGYVRGIQHTATQEGWQAYLDWTSAPHSASGTLLASIFYGNNTPLAPFHGETPDFAVCAINNACWFPDHVVRLRLDGSVATTSWQKWQLPLDKAIFSWEGLFSYAE